MFVPGDEIFNPFTHRVYLVQIVTQKAGSGNEYFVSRMGLHPKCGRPYQTVHMKPIAFCQLVKRNALGLPHLANPSQFLLHPSSSTTSMSSASSSTTGPAKGGPQKWLKPQPERGARARR